MDFTVDAVNDVPVANDDMAAVDGGDTVVIDVLANDADPDGTLDPTTVTIMSGPADGTVAVDPVSGRVTYAPDPGFMGVDTFTYEVCDDLGACATAIVRVSVNSAPIALDDTAATIGGHPVAIDVLANDSDPDGTLDVGTLRVTNGPDHGSIAIDPVTGVITYTPDADASGADTFTYEICDTDPELVCSSAVVTIDVNGLPVAVDDAVAVKSDGSVVIDPLANDHDLDDELDPASVAIAEPPAHGTVTVDPATGRITYVPDPGYSGPDSFTYRVCDTGDPVACATARVAVTVGAPATSSAIEQLMGDTPSRLAWPAALLAGIIAAAWVLARARRRLGDDTPR